MSQKSGIDKSMGSCRTILLLIITKMFLMSNFSNLAVKAQSSPTTTTGVASPQNSPDESFSPIVEATCRAGIMTVKVQTLHNFEGVVHSRDYRKPKCSGYGEKTKVTLLRINMLAEENDDDYCGIFSGGSEDKSIAIAVRAHKTLELVGDKFYMITCGKAGYQNTKNQTSLVTLNLLSNNRKVEHAVYGREYVLKAFSSKPDGKFGMLVKRCFSFSDTDNQVLMVDDKGCSNNEIMSEFEYKDNEGEATAYIYSMFKFPESNRVHFQCDILVCPDICPKESCDKVNSTSFSKSQSNSFLQASDDGALMASYSIFVVEPGTPIESVCDSCDDPSYKWFHHLCIVFGVLFLIMLIINIFLCSAMTCSCTKADEEEKEASMIEEFDPYTRSWHGSQYGSRYSLNRVSGSTLKPIPPPLISVDTVNSLSSNASDYGMPAVYGIPVHSRPSSRVSNRSGPKHRPGMHASSSSGSTHYSKYSNGRLIK
ncbi:uncharacterized protein [Lepeophtheirus salmonis]|uniref:uncharacterized protein n=1 Tax=Lepeophtheirus salmonis TaxID=72036 RepID=UPI001AE4D5D2|nr:uncharacterized protein LOC121120579 isoform X1 [Lepeophtheirus salmonis]